jgi:hypothetical protein
MTEKSPRLPYGSETAGAGGGGGCMRQSMIFQTSTTSNTTTKAAIHRRKADGARCIAYSASVSMRSARAKSNSVKPPLLWVERTSRTLL